MKGIKDIDHIEINKRKERIRNVWRYKKVVLADIQKEDRCTVSFWEIIRL